MTQQKSFRPRPSREQVAELPLFPGLALEQIHTLETMPDFEAARRAIEKEKVLGFDTESKPTFAKDVVRLGPHVIQFALQASAYIVQVQHPAALDFLKDILESEEIIKVGFGLRSDRLPLSQNLGMRLRGGIDLSQALRSLGHKDELGIRAAVAVVLHQRLRKSKRVTLSNWAAKNLRPEQLLYAANDAFAALQVFRAMGSPHGALMEA
jgi:ribonuclease D